MARQARPQSVALSCATNGTVRLRPKIRRTPRRAGLLLASGPVEFIGPTSRGPKIPARGLREAFGAADALRGLPASPHGNPPAGLRARPRKDRDARQP